MQWTRSGIVNFKKLYGFGIAAAFAAGIVSSPVAAQGVKGVVKYDGPKPKITFIKMNADKKCVAMHGDQQVPHQEEVIGANGEVKNVFVWVKEGVKGRPFAAPAEHAKIDQKGCMYEPRVQGMIAGQTLDIVNSDETMHNVRGFGKKNPPFNLGQPVPGTREKTFKKVEKAIKIKCDVHPWMFAYIHVVDHPYFAVTGDDGTFEIKDLPAGEYTIAAWHEKYGEQEMKVTVGGEGPAKADFTFAAQSE